MWAMGGDVFDKDMKNVTVNSQIAKDALALYIELYKTGANYDKNDLVASVSKGKAAMSLGWPSWFISGSDSLANYAVIPGKKDASSPEYSAGVIGNWMMALPPTPRIKILPSNCCNTSLQLKYRSALPTKVPFLPVLLSSTMLI